ncbi:TnsD family Tn7-like transposition protein [Serpentinicella alkaliphila]|uniref:TniQ protein n=1 Tax=Serpentinicella alkaliphila TaxID=1734049 RepID=A0A4R2U2N2_9FIRM|nr:TnsD family Tn7-like transposition protein [Serpentinicella alkaliphila]QUH25551.1 TniQ family protein [Serpentinicella alkaliphila]TCQ01903.1 TniQ protein [Serpentinicella alkaliphila]
MLNFTPIPYPDELLSNIFSRYHKMSGNISYFHTLEDLFGIKGAIAAIDFPSKLTNFCSHYPELSKYNDEEYFIYEHTIFSIFKPFIPENRASKVINAMKNNEGKAINMSLGIMAAGICKSKSLKVCSSCIEEDKELYGEAYIHRTHQVPGYNVCVKHNQIMSEFFIPYDKSYAKYIHIDEISKSELLVQIDLNCYFKEFYELSKDIEIINTNYLKNSNVLNSYDRYYYMLNKKGYVTPKGRIKRKKLYHDFMIFYPDGFLSILDSKIEEKDEESWVYRIAYRDKQVIHPIRHLLFIKFLFTDIYDFINLEEVKYHPFGNKPWPCLNPVAEHYKENIVEICEITTDSKTGRPVGKFTCNCGFIYSRRGPDSVENDRYRIGNKKQFGHIWEQKLKDLIINKNCSVKKMSRELYCDEKTVVKYANKLGLLDLLKTNIKPYPTKNTECKYHAYLSEPYKDEILKLLKEFPQYSRTQIRKKAEKEYHWLYKYRRNWLESKLLKSSNSESKRMPNSKVNWEERDRKINEKVKIAIDEIKGFKKPMRLTIGLISKIINYSPLREKLDKLPNTKITLETNVESIEDFHIRKMIIIVDDLREKDKKITKSKIIELAGLSRRSEKVNQLIIDTVEL